MASTAAAMPKAKPRQYRDFLTPALHRQFTRAFLLVCGVCYTESVLLGSWRDPLWSWFPLGFAGIRTLLLCVPVLAVFFIRVSNNHVGTRSTLYPLQTFFQQATSLSNIWLYLYFFSAWFFSEITIWSAPTSANLAWVTPLPGDKVRLNERAIFFRVVFVVLAVVQSVWHLYIDEDKIILPVPTAATGEKENANTVQPPRSQIKRRLVEIGITSLSKAGISIVGGFAIYHPFLRQFLWDLFFSWFRYPFTLRQYHKPTGIVPALDIVSRILYATTLLTFLWDFSNAAFSAYIAQEPLKKDQPITAESKDPNGSLIRGLDHRLKTAKSYAFWELWIITTKFPERRKTIFADIDREPSTWTQVSTLCLREIRGVSDRINAFNDAQASKPTPEDAANGSAEATLQKQAAVPPLKTDDIVAQTPPPKSRVEKVGRLAGSFAKQHGLSPSSPPRPLQGATKAISLAERKLLTEPQRQEIADAPKNVRQAAGGALMAFLKNRFVGWPFRQPFARRAAAVVCGAPSARTSIIVFAARSLAKLCTESLREDPYGAVAKGVKSIVGAYADAIRDIERFLRDAKPHWTDVYFNEPQRGNVEEVNTVVDALRVGLQGILGAFGEYASSLGISEKELAEAKMLAGGREMTEKKT